MTAHHVPVQVTAYLSHGFAAAQPWGIALDGILASELWSDHVATSADPGLLLVVLIVSGWSSDRADERRPAEQLGLDAPWPYDCLCRPVSTPGPRYRSTLQQGAPVPAIPDPGWTGAGEFVQELAELDELALHAQLHGAPVGAYPT